MDRIQLIKLHRRGQCLHAHNISDSILWFYQKLNRTFSRLCKFQITPVFGVVSIVNYDVMENLIIGLY